jgi:hypothetical protein
MARREQHPPSPLTDRGLGGPRNETYKHLEDPLRLSGLTIGQWVGLLGSGLVAIVFGLYLSPLPPGVTIGVSLFVAGLPLALSYAVSGFDMAISQTIAAVYRWARGAKHYLPGAEAPAAGYVVLRTPGERHVPRSPEQIAAARRQLQGAWDL